MADRSIRYRGSRLAYAHAVLSLVTFARASDTEFAFGPVSLPAMLKAGLVVSGTHRELRQVSDLLRYIPDLYEADS
jgi:hypothetical protein